MLPDFSETKRLFSAHQDKLGGQDPFQGGSFERVSYTLDQQFADAAGNAYLRAPGLYLLVTGRKTHLIEQREYYARPQVVDARAFAPAGLKTLFAFICRPELAAAPYRHIAEAAGVALGGLPALLAGMQQEGYIAALETKRRLLPTKRLLDDWATAYARTLRPKQLVRTLVAPTFENWRDWHLPEHARWGGEPAAALLTNLLRPGILTIYADKPPHRLIVEQRWTTVRALDEYNLIEIRAPFWGATLLADSGDKLMPPPLVPPPLVYADLLAVGGARCIEAAQQIYEDHLARLFPNR